MRGCWRSRLSCWPPPLGTPHTAELLKASAGTGAPVLCPFTGAERLRAAPNRLLFHIRAGYKDEIAKMVEQLTTLGVKRIALFYQNDPFGEEGLEHLEAALQRQGLKMAARATYERGSLDVGAAVKTLSAADPQAVVMFAVTRAAAELVKRMQEAGRFTQFLTLSLNGNDDFVEAIESIGRYDAGGFEIGYTAASHLGSRYVDLTVIDGSGRFLR